MESSPGTVRTIDKIRIISNNGVEVSVDPVKLKISVDDLIREKYKRGQKLDEAGWFKLIKQAIEFLAKNYSLNLLTYSSKSEAELKRRIDAKIRNWLGKNRLNIDKDIIGAIVDSNLDFLKKRNFVDDQAYAESMLRKYKNKSNKEIFYKLIGKGVDREKINKLLIDSDDRERLAAKTLIIKKLKGKNRLDRDEKRKLLASLYRKGFSIKLVKTEIDELANNE